MMSFQAKRELLAQVAPRYRKARGGQKSRILDEFLAATGYQRKYAIRLLRQPPPFSPAMKRPRARRYGPPVQDALKIAWAAANFICSKRLVPFLPEVVPVLERHGHLQLEDEVRGQLLPMSVSTAERLLAAIRRQEQPHGRSTTKSGVLLKRQIPVRTFNDWNETQPGFFEGDLVAHCGWSIEGEFLNTLVLTDVATGWTKCLALLHRSQAAVVQALDRARQLLPFPMLGFDSDNGSEFINAELLAYCEREHLTLTRGRVAKKNDQCFVEQQNGNIVRQYVGYDRFEGERAYRQLVELYRALRLYINFCQPSMKRLSKQRDGSKVQRKYEPAQTPLQRLLAAYVLTAEAEARLQAVYHSLDPVRLLQQIVVLQDALWHLALMPAAADGATDQDTSTTRETRFNRAACGLGSVRSEEGRIAAPDSQSPPASNAEHKARRYHRTKQPPAAYTWRTRHDPFESVWADVCRWLAADPGRTTQSILNELQQLYPEQFPDSQLRTMQCRVREWRAQSILTFDDQWLQEESAIKMQLPRPLQAVVER
jgi:hypothetical protein